MFLSADQLLNDKPKQRRRDSEPRTKRTTGTY